MDESESNNKILNGESKEPSIFSKNADERKLARRLRIQRRLQEAARLESIRDGTYVEPETEKPPLDHAIEASEDVLENLFLEGKELVSNIGVASDAREVERREIEADNRNNRLKTLEEEAAVALEKLGEITERWNIIQNLNDPLSLHQHMKEQRAKCLELIEQKNGLIKDFQTELKLADEKYMKDRGKMYEDLSLLTQRIDEQVLVMKKAYRLELKNIEDVVDETRSKILEEHQRRWQLLYDQREKDEVTNMEKIFKLVEDHESELKELHTEHEEKYRESRIKYETDLQTLEQEYERVKALCLLNSEKLDYNYQVLKKREEENIYIKNHQKRNLNKLQDTMNKLKKKIEEKQNSTDLEIKRLQNDVSRYHDNFVELEKKAQHFSQMNDDTYQSIWDMKEEEAKGMLQKILSIDKIIHEQILGINWAPPDMKPMDKRELPSYKIAKKVVGQFCAKPAEAKHNIDLGEGNVPENKKNEYKEGHQRLLSSILEMVADQSGFLIEEKLDELLKPYTSEEKTLVRLDNVFTAIGINTERDVDLLKNIFLPYAVCPVCDANQRSEQSFAFGDQFEENKQESIRNSSKNTELDDKLSKIMSGASAASLEDSMKTDEESVKKPDFDPVQLLQKDDFTYKANSFQCSITHPLMIEKIYVLNALKDFVAEFHSSCCRLPTGMNVRLAKKRNTISRMLAKEDVEKYWMRFKTIFPSENEKIWNALLIGLARYHAMLQDRHKLNIKAQKLRQQNAELRRLLKRYVPEDSNEAKLFLPPLSKSDRNIADLGNLGEIIAAVKYNFGENVQL